jgi:hypothetical protein
LLRDSQGFIAADLDRDFAVDQADFGSFQRCYSGEGAATGFELRRLGVVWPAPALTSGSRRLQ